MVTYPSDWIVKDPYFTLEDSQRVPVTASERPVGTTPYYGANGVQGFIDGYTHRGEYVLIAEDGANDISDYPVHYVNGKIWVNNHAHAIRGITGVSDTKYLSYAFKVIDYSAILVGGTRAKLNGSALRAITMPLPNLPEQWAIAEVLSGFDEHLANLDELITKKKAIRDGALETLASGRQRLSGFTGYWRDTTLGAIATLNPVTPVPDTFTYVDLESVQGTEMVTSRRLDKIAAPSRAQRLASSGDIFFQTVRPYQRNNYLFKSSAKDVVFSTGYVQIRTQEVPEFLFAAVQQNHFIDQVLERCTGTSYPAITPTALKEVSVRLPKSHSEQRAIR